MGKLYLLSIALFGLTMFSCGPSAEELKRLQEIEDSIAEVERIKALEKASQLLEQADSLAADSLLKDSIANDSIQRLIDSTEN